MYPWLPEHCVYAHATVNIAPSACNSNIKQRLKKHFHVIAADYQQHTFVHFHHKIKAKVKVNPKLTSRYLKL